MIRKYYRVAIGMLLAVFMVFGSVVSPLSGAFDVFAAENGKWIYVDGQNGNDGNDGSSAGSAVKSWDKAKALLGCAEGGIYVVGTVQAEGFITTKMPDKQVVKRTSDIVMFNVASEASFANIVVDGEDKAYDSPAIKPAENAKLNFLKGSKFQNIGYVENASRNEEKAGAGMGAPDNEIGGMVCLVVKGVKILVDGAEFSNNNGKGIFFAPLKGFDFGPRAVSLTMKSGTVTGNKGYFYHNECTVGDNRIYIYNALIKNNDASHMGDRYTAYKNRSGAVYVCDAGTVNLQSTDGAAIYDNNAHDLIYISNDSGSNISFQNASTMLGGGDPKWSYGIVADPVASDANNHYDVYDSNPDSSAKENAEASATSIFTDNKSTVINSNGEVNFGKGDETVPETPEVPADEQGCDDTPTPTAKPKVTNTTAKANGTAATEQNAAEVTITKGDAVAITDDVAFEGLAENVTYTVKSELWSNGSVQQTKTTEVTSATASPITVSFDNVSPEAQQQFNIRTVLLKDGQEVAVHNDGRNTVSERVIVKVEEPAVVYTPAIKNTTAKAKQGNGEEVSASEGAAANVTVAADEALNLTISDVIELEGLNPEKEYTLKTYLWYNGQKQLTKETTVSGDVTSLTVSFDDAVTTEASETGYNISNELYDGNEMVAEHNGSRNIVSERVTVTREEPEEPTEPKTPTEPENPTPDEPTNPETPEEPEDPTPDEPTQPTSKIKLTTKVKNQYISPAKDQTIIDIVTAKGLEEGKEYTLKGEIRKADGSENGTVISSSNAPCPITSDVDQFQAEMTFSKIDASSLKAGDKLVVFEYLYEGDDEATKDFKPGDDNEIAKHANINSAAQTTMIVDGQIKISKKADVEIVEAGKDVPYTITVTNERNVPAVVDVVDTPEAGLIYKEADNDASYDSDEKTVIWEDLEVPANGTITLSIVFTVSEDASGKLKNRAKVNEPDNPGNVLGINEDDDDVKVLGVYDEENDDNPKNKAKTKGANTGDDAPMAGAILALLAAAGAFEVMRRRRMN